MPKLEYLMTYRAELRRPIDVGAGPSGARQVHDVTGGTFEGPRLRGRVLPSGADWLLVGSDGVGRLDVRLTLETDDAAHVYVQYLGVLVFDERFVEAIGSGGETQFGDTTFLSQPRFETGDPRYAWLNSVVALGEGRVVPGAVEYRVFAVEHDQEADPGGVGLPRKASPEGSLS